jgi:hypothetical protein
VAEGNGVGAGSGSAGGGAGVLRFERALRCGAGVLTLCLAWMNGIDERDLDGGRVVLLDDAVEVDAKSLLGPKLIISWILGQAFKLKLKLTNLITHLTLTLRALAHHDIPISRSGLDSQTGT